MDHFGLEYAEVHRILENNKSKIDNKLKTPRKTQALISSKASIDSLNELIDEINIQIEEHNSKIDNKNEILGVLKAEFWSAMRWKYDQTISRFDVDSLAASQNLKEIENDLAELIKQIDGERQTIAKAQAETVNVEQAIQSINSKLNELGMDSFYIEKYSENLYRISRTDDPEHAFHSLSEGEKMIISFLYFC